MPRLVCPALTDPTNTATSIAASPSRFINTYTESVAPGHGKSPLFRLRTPGVHVFLQVDDERIVRGLFTINERAFAVIGGTFYEFFEDGTFAARGSVVNDTLPVSMASSGNTGQQIILCSGGFGYIYTLNTNTLQQITDGNFPYPVRTCEYLDGYFLVQQGSGSTRIQWSALNDGQTWPALQFAYRSIASDNLTAIMRSHKDIWLIGSRTSEVWTNTGDLNNTFAPIPGVFVEHGAQGIFSPVRLDNTLFWMGMGYDGRGVIWRMNGYTPQRVSTFAIETVLQRAIVPTDAVAWAYQINGHLNYVLTLPRDVETSLVYDITMDRWHEWGHWDATACRYIPHLAWNHVEVFSRHFVGDRFHGVIYELSQDFEDDELVLGLTA